MRQEAGSASLHVGWWRRGKGRRARLRRRGTHHTGEARIADERGRFIHRYARNARQTLARQPTADRRGRVHERRRNNAAPRRRQLTKPLEELQQSLLALGRHPIEVGPAVGHLPELRTLHRHQLIANRRQSRRLLVRHVAIHLARSSVVFIHQVVRRKLHLRLAHPAQGGFLLGTLPLFVHLQKDSQQLGALLRLEIERQLVERA